MMLPQLFKESIVIMFAIAAAPLALSAAAGLLVACMQAVTQSQEQTTSYLARWAALSAALYWIWPRVETEMRGFFVRCLEFAAAIGRA